jgi:hypothetical protein
MFASRLGAEPLFFAYRVLKLVLLHIMLRVSSAIHVVHDLDFTVCTASLLVLHDFLGGLLMNICQTVVIGKQSRAAALGLLIYEHSKHLSRWFYLLTPIFGPSHYYRGRGKL